MTVKHSDIDLTAFIRDVPDFPQPGILFKDITPLLREPAALRAVIDRLTEACAQWPVDLVVAAEARGFLLGPALAVRLAAGFAPVRKPGKLPAETRAVEYELEYGTNALQIHTDAVTDGQRVLLVDDLLATGGTMAATTQLVEASGGYVVGFAFIIELAFLKGRRKLPADKPIVSLIQY